MSEDAKNKSQMKMLCPLEKVLRVDTLLVGLRLPAEEIRENLGGQSIGDRASGNESLYDDDGQKEEASSGVRYTCPIEAEPE